MLASPVHTLFIGGLPPEANVELLERLFGGIAGLRSARVVTDRDGGCRGFGYVTFDSRDAVCKARELDGQPLGPCRLRVAPAR